MKQKKNSDRLNKIDEWFNNIINMLIPAIIVMIPIVFILYLFNLHGYLNSIIGSNQVIFSLDRYYRYLMYILGFIYVFKVITGKVKITKSDWFLFIFVIFTITSTIFAYNIEIALYGYPNRYEGLFTILFYVFLYLDCKSLINKTDISYLLRLMVGISFVQLLVVILQLTGIFEKVIYMYTSGNAIGLTENCNFLGSLMCTFSMISVGGYILFNKKENSNYYLIIFVISYVTLLLANSTGPFISFIGTMLIFLIFLFKKKRIVIKKWLIILLIVISLYPICLYKNDSITPEIKSNASFVISKIKGLFSKNNYETSKNDLEVRDLGHGRIRIWSNVIELIEEKPLFGYGPDNLGLVYKKSFDDNKVADKAHNIYLQILVSSGIFALIGYLLWLISTIYLGLKSSNSLIVVLSFGIIAYSIQGIFNINVLEVTPYFYLLVGFMMLLVNEKALKKA